MLFRIPEIEYAAVGDSRIAYQVLGTGPPDLVWIGPWWSHIDGRWEDPVFRHFLLRLAGFSRLIAFDKRGAGASDGLPRGAGGTWEAWVDDVRAVMAAAGSSSAVVCGVLDSGPVAILLASTFPGLASHLVLVNSAARFTQAEGYPWGLPIRYAEDFIRATRETWGRGALLEFTSPSRASDPDYRDWWSRYQRMAANPAMVETQYRIMMASDCRHILPAVQVPTLVVHRTEMATVPLEHGRYLAEAIEGATLVELPGADVPVFSGDADAIADAIETFITGDVVPRSPERVLKTVVLTDIVDSTHLAVQLGDASWRELLDAHDEIARRVIDQHHGQLVRTTGDGILATFDGPERALRACVALRGDLSREGLRIRIGLHTGEIDIRGVDIGGVTVHVAARVNALAEPGEIVATEAVKKLVVGSEVALTERGSHALKGLPGSWPLFSALPRGPSR